MGTDPHGHDPSRRAGHEHDRDYVDKDVASEDVASEDVVSTEPVQREGDYADKDVAPAVPTEEREGEYTDSDVGSGDTDPPKGSYVSRDDTP